MWLLVFLLLVWASVAQAAVSAVGTASAQTTGASASNTMTFSHNSGAGGANRLLICGISKRAISDASGITYNTVALTFLHEQALNANGVELWYLTSPDTGTHDVVVTMGVSMAFVTGCQTYQDVNLAGPFNTISGADGTSTSAPLTGVASAVGELVFSVLGRRDSTDAVTTDGGQDELWNLSTAAASNNIGVGSQEAGAASVNLNYTWSNSHSWSHAAVSLKSAPSATTKVRRLSHGQ